jgi:hypothetical protein
MLVTSFQLIPIPHKSRANSKNCVTLRPIISCNGDENDSRELASHWLQMIGRFMNWWEKVIIMWLVMTTHWEYRIILSTITDKTDAFSVESCHAHFVDEATTEDEENCKLIFQDERLSLVATTTMEPGDQLIPRYGHQPLSKLKYPLLLPRQMYEKYRLLNLTAAEHAQWKEIIAFEKQEEQRYLCTLSAKHILCNTTPEFYQLPVTTKKPIVCLARTNEIQRNKKRWERKKHCWVVASGITPSKKIRQDARLRYFLTMLTS